MREQESRLFILQSHIRRVGSEAILGCKIWLGKEKMEEVNEFKYLGTILCKHRSMEGEIGIGRRKGVERRGRKRRNKRKRITTGKEGRRGRKENGRRAKEKEEQKCMRRRKR